MIRSRLDKDQGMVKIRSLEFYYCPRSDPNYNVSNAEVTSLKSDLADRDLLIAALRAEVDSLKSAQDASQLVRQLEGKLASSESSLEVETALKVSNVKINTGQVYEEKNSVFKRVIAWTRTSRILLCFDGSGVVRMLGSRVF